MSLTRRLSALFRTSRRDREMRAELEHHLDLETEANVRRGLDPEAARREAHRAFGSVAFVEDACRDAWPMRLLDSLRQDVRIAIRGFRRAPLFAAAAAATLALGIGANSAIFSVVDAVLIERLPFRDPGRVVAVWEENEGRPGKFNVIGPANFLQWRARATSFDSLSAFYDSTPSLTGSGEPEEITAQTVTPGYFGSLGVSPMLGRVFTAADVTGDDPTVVVLSEQLWSRRFARDPAIVGRVIDIASRPVTVVGVMPADARLFLARNSFTGEPPQVWLPLAFPPAAREPRGRYLSAIGRLKSGVSLDQARAEMNTIAASLEQRWPQFDHGWRVRLTPLRDELSGDLRPSLLALAGAVVFVLLIACANVANLLLSRGAARRRELAIRSAIGAGRGRVVRQLLTESVMLAILGGAAGLLLAWAMLRVLLALSPVDLSITAAGVHLNGSVLAFTALVSLATAVACGLAPAIESARIDAGADLGAGSRQTASAAARRLRQAFVVAQVALGIVLLVGAGLMIRSVLAMRAVNPGFVADRVLTARVTLPTVRYPEGDARRRFFEAAVSQIRALPGVQSAGMVSFLPFADLGAATDFTIVGAPPPAPGQEPVIDVRVCDNGYFDAMRIPLRHGRRFTDREMRETSNVVLINETMARQYWPAGDAIGHRVSIDMGPVGGSNEPSEIIGIVGDVVMHDVATAARATSYWPFAQLPYSGMRLAVRTAGDPLALAPAVERVVHGLDANQPISDVKTMDQWLAKSMAQTRFSAALLGAFAAVALLLAAIGLYGVVAYSVTQRTAEIGIRLALGAAPRGILSMIVGQGIGLAAIGVLLGVPLALALAGAIRALLFGTSTADPLTLTAAVASLAIVAGLASYLPARRAARIEPTVALRYE